MTVVVGRDKELAAVGTFLSAREAAGLLLVDGAPGIGKTTFFRAAVDQAIASGYRVLRARPAETEVDLSFSGLGDLLEQGVAADLSILPEPQRAALEVALLIRSPTGTSLQSRAAGTGFLNVLRSLAAERRVLVAVDDAQWLDQASVSVIRFAARRLTSEPVRLLLTRRSGSAPDLGTWIDDVEEIALPPLTLGAIHAILFDHLGTVQRRPVLRRIHEWSRGNPMHALELGRAFAGGSARFDAASAVPIGLESLVASRIHRLPEQTRCGLAAAAASRSPTTGLIASALEVEDSHPALAPAIADGIVEINGDEIRFTHPLLASAAHASVDRATLKSLHARLAAVVEDPDEGARHLAHSIDGQDTEVAAALERAADNVFHRGAPSLASGLAELARSVTPTEDQAAIRRRTLLEAEYRFEAGDTLAASELVSELVEDTGPGPERAGLWARLARYQHFAHGLSEGAELFKKARAEAGDDQRLRFEIEEGLTWNLLLMRGDLSAADEAAATALRLAEGMDDPAALGEALAVSALTRSALGATDMSLIERSLELEPQMLGMRVLRHSGFSYASLLTSLDRFDEARRVFEDLLSRADAHGDESALPTLLHHIGLIYCLAGDLTTGLSYAQEAAAVAAQDEQVPARISALGRVALIEARRGAPDQAEMWAGQAFKLACPEGFDPADPVLAMSRGGEAAMWAVGLAALFRGQAGVAASFLNPMTDTFRTAGYRQLGEMRFLVDTVDALCASGSSEGARSLVEWMGTMPRERPSGLAAVALARGLLAAAEGDLASAETHLAEAVDAAKAAPLPFELGRALLAHGRVQRRSKAKIGALRTLESAGEVFGRIGSRGWAELAAEEGRRVGGGERSVEGLTPTEIRVAELVAAGSTNKEVAQMIYVSSKTVEATLTRIYAKLGIRSRTELVRWVIDRAGSTPK
jgi:DNA-binding CsgD family transcriptional regulator/tetratricopeptide (TPR) repeat protein